MGRPTTVEITAVSGTPTEGEMLPLEDYIERLTLQTIVTNDQGTARAITVYVRERHATGAASNGNIIPYATQAGMTDNTSFGLRVGDDAVGMLYDRIGLGFDGPDDAPGIQTTVSRASDS